MKVAYQGEGPKCEVCGRSLHKLQTCPICGKMLCNVHLSPSRHDCIPTMEAGPRAEVATTTEGKSRRKVPIKAIIVLLLIAAVAVSATLVLMKGNKEVSNQSSGRENVANVSRGSNFSVELSLLKIREAMMGGMGRQIPGSFPGNRTGAGDFGNRSRPGGFGNVTRPGGLGFQNVEFLVAVPDSLKVLGVSSTSAEIAMIRESQDGYTIYDAKILEPSSSQTSIILNLKAPASAGDFDIYYTLQPLSGLGSAATQRTIGSYVIGDLVFLVREKVGVS